jgi:hypothetical protein
MKNHLGTFINAGTDNNPSSTGLHTLDAILEINKHPAILGGNPVRQQLCIVDSLLANGNSAGGSFDTRVDRIVMGTFAPTVDYCTATNIMASVMNKPDRNNNLPKFLTSFGYAATDVMDWNEYVPGSGPSATGGTGGSATGGTGGSATGGTGGSATGGARTGGINAAGGVGTGGSNATGGAANGGSSSTGGVASGGSNSTAGVASGGSSTGGAGSGGSTAPGGARSGGTLASGGTTGNGGTTSAGTGAGGMGGAATSAPSPTGGGTATARKSDGGCSVAASDRSATRWSAMLALAAGATAKLRRLVVRQDNQAINQTGQTGTDHDMGSDGDPAP